jgi:deoxycytidylate deaminase/dephospho-CoA kinase
MDASISAGIEQAYLERTDLFVVALTGRTGSGCSTAAAIFCKRYDEISITPGDFPELEQRKLAIANRFCSKQWVPFKSVSVSTVILGFLLNESNADITKFLDDLKVRNSAGIIQILDSLRDDKNYSEFKACIFDDKKDAAPRAWTYYNEILKIRSGDVRSSLANAYAPVFQTLGDNIRFSGRALSRDIEPNKLFSLIRSVKRLVKAAFAHDRETRSAASTRIVIDAIRNPLELVYLRDQFSAFYAIAITTDDEHRKERLEDINLTKKEIKALDEKEYSENKKPLDNYENFVSQNLQDCIQKSDIFFANPGVPSEFAQNIRNLNAQVLRYVALMLRPGLITPTRDERCMQLAFVAKLNSGCISRQVGAAVADENFSIKAVGWNDVPKGQVSCLLRDVDELLTGGDKNAFSTFEKTDKKLLAQIKKTYQNRGQLEHEGLPCPFCFKTEYNKSIDKDNQVHTRSLHAEENAFLQLAKHGNSGIDKGHLFTTASPCELCSKKAFQLGIKEIVYVDPYPGISSSHILSSGDTKLRPKLRLFSGAVGHAYHRLYEAILPIKDEYMARLASGPQQPLL